MSKDKCRKCERMRTMGIDDLLTGILAQQDQDLESAVAFCTTDGGKSYNAQLMPLCSACCLDHENELIDCMSRFALIGIRTTILEIQRRQENTDE